MAAFFMITMPSCYKNIVFCMFKIIDLMFKIIIVI